MTRLAPRFRILVLTGWGSPSTLQAITRLLAVPGVEVAGRVYDRGAYTVKARLRRFWRRGRRDGVVALLGRILARACRLCIPAGPRYFAPRPIRRAIFAPEVHFLTDLATRHHIPYCAVDSLNSSEGQRHISSLHADLGVVIGTRILTRDTFALPRLGSINIHTGRVPQYRGQPRAFWELALRAQIEGVGVQGIMQRFRAFWGLPGPSRLRPEREPLSVAGKKHESV